MRRRGFTLIELMVALAIVSLLSVLAFRAVTAATAGEQRLAAALERWRAVARFVEMAEADVAQMLARPLALGGDAALTRATGPAGTLVELSFLRGDGGGRQLRRMGYRLADGRLYLLRWPGSDALSQPREDLLLDKVKDLRWRFHRDDGSSSDRWPPEAALPGEMPLAVVMELELEDMGTLRRLLPLR